MGAGKPSVTGLTHGRRTRPLEAGRVSAAQPANSGDERLRVLAGVKALKGPVDAAELEYALHALWSRDNEQPPLLCAAGGARVEQHMDAAHVQEREAPEIEDELCAPAVEGDIELRPGQAFVPVVQLAIEPHDRARAVAAGRRRELRTWEGDHHDHIVTTIESWFK